MKEKAKIVPYIAPSIEEFKQMAPAQKRVTIAKDIIAALNAEIYKAYVGRYLSTFTIDDDDYSMGYMSASTRQQDIQKTLPNMKNCEVCAMGACILSITKYENKLTFNDVGKVASDISEETAKLIEGVFTPLQMCMIEIMFEGYWKSDESNLAHAKYYVTPSEKAIDTCIEFKKRYDRDPDKRMRAIMQHIIKNKGEISLANMNPKPKKV